jgi:hypothetical protein
VNGAGFGIGVLYLLSQERRLEHCRGKSIWNWAELRRNQVRPGGVTPRLKGVSKMSTTTILIVIVVLILLFGGGYGYRRWR